MIQLANGCYCSEISVSPKNWNKSGATTKKDWFIFYRFYDPSRKDAKGRIKPVMRKIKGINAYKQLSERRAACKILMENEIVLLKEQGYNPFTGSIIESENVVSEIHPSTEFSAALKMACEKLDLAKNTKDDIESMLNYVNPALHKLGYSCLQISCIKRRHIKTLLEQCGKMKETWTAATYNKYRYYLKRLFKELKEYEAIEDNPLIDVSKRKVEKKIRQTLADEERIRIDKHLKEKYYPFWRFVQIFFHSGGRIVELLGAKCCYVNLEKQTYTVTIRKGPEIIHTEKIIKDVALPLWKELLATSNPDDYIFSVGLLPGKSKIRREQLTRRWNVHIKKKLGVEADLYSLKHLNTTEIVEALSNEDAAKLNSHASTEMVNSIYDVRFSERQISRIKKVTNTFSK